MFHLLYQHPLKVLIHIMAALLLTQLPAYDLGGQ